MDLSRLPKLAPNEVVNRWLDGVQQDHGGRTAAETTTCAKGQKRASEDHGNM